MRIAFIDVVPITEYRISKDTSGGYGTGNDFGDTIIPNILKKLLKKNSNWPPLFAAYSFSVLKEKKHDVTYFNNFNFSYDYDLFIIVSSIVSHETELEVIKKLRAKNLAVIAIGPFASTMSELYIKTGCSVVIGEPEFYFLNEENIDLNTTEKKLEIDKNFEQDINKLPFPKFTEMGYNLKKINNLFGKKKSIPILATRGCPFSCFQYCVYPLQQGRKVRQRTINNIVSEIEYWTKKHGVEVFIFRDPVFSINKKHTIELANKIIEKKLNINFVIETHLKILDKELLELLKKAGLTGVKVGIESYEDDVLKDAGRYTIKKDDQVEKIKMLHDSDIRVSAMYILGYPEDTESSVLKTINYAKKLNTYYAQFSIWTPYPGTPVYEKILPQISEKKLENFNQYNLTFDHANFSKKKIRFFLSKAYSQYYLRINWAFKHLIKYPF